MIWIKREIDLTDLSLWSAQARETVERVVREEKIQDLEWLLCEHFGSNERFDSLPDLGEIDDLFDYEQSWIYKQLGIKPEEKGDACN